MKDRIIPDGFLLENEGVILEAGPMAQLPSGNFNTLSCDNLYLSPGFIDIHTHGGGNYDFRDDSDDAIINAGRTHMRHGTTCLIPTTSCCTDETLFRFIKNFIRVKKIAVDLPFMSGLHLEGPYLSMEQRGGQNPAFIAKPSPEHYEKILELAEGNIVRWTVAPELDGALEMGRRLSSQGILMSIGHSNATYDEVLAAVDSGYSHITHLYSCTSTIIRKSGFRILGINESSYIIDSLTVEIIADGLHLPPELIKLILRSKDNEKICLVTDSIRYADGDINSTFGGTGKEKFPIIIEDGIAKLPDRTSFAGSIATSDRLIQTMVNKAGLPLEKAVAMLTRIPAAIMGIKKKGSLLSGNDADFILFDESINVKKVFLSGREMDIKKPA